MARAEAMDLYESEPEPESDVGVMAIQAGDISLNHLPVIDVGGIQMADASVMGRTVWPSASVLARFLPTLLERATPPPSIWSVPLDRPLGLEIGAG